MTRVLIVDDQEDNRLLLRTLLQGGGWEVAEARDGAEALARARHDPPDLVISDLLMPVMDGYTLLRIWKADERLRLIPFVVYTSTYTGSKDEQLARDLGADAFLLKPIEPGPFLACIREVVSDGVPPSEREPREPPADLESLQGAYSEVLVRKLEAKALELERANQELAAREARLSEAQERLQRAVDSGKVGLWDWDLRTNQVKYSREWKRQIGYDDDEIDDDYDAWQSQIHPGDLDRALRTVAAYLDGDEPDYESEFRFRHKDGSYRHILARASEVRDADGKRVRLVGSHVDLTDSVELEARLLQAQKMESLGRLAGGVAHDFNNLLTVIGGFADLALMGLKEGDPLRSHLQEIARAGERAGVLTRQLLAFSRRQILRLEVLNLSTVLEGMEVMLRRLIGEDVELDFRPAPDLGNVRADAGQIEQVVMNLVVNARDAMPKGGRLTIVTENVDLDAAHAAENPAAEPGPHVLLAISDTGNGMDEATRARIFEPFFTTKEPGQGTGLGLATAYGIVKQSGGSIETFSELGQGTTFKVYLPRVLAAASGADPAPAATPSRGVETILVVEDEDALRNLTAQSLAAAGYTVLGASNGGAALLQLERHDGEVHLLLTDVVMPGMSGPELAERLARVRPAMKVLYMSGYTDDAVLRHGVLEGAVELIGKPYSVAELARRVRRVLDA